MSAPNCLIMIAVDIHFVELDVVDDIVVLVAAAVDIEAVVADDVVAAVHDKAAVVLSVAVSIVSVGADAAVVVVAEVDVILGVELAEVVGNSLYWLPFDVSVIGLVCEPNFESE